MAKGFFKGVKAELKKVVWPTKKQLLNNTFLVLLLVIVLAAVILGFDLAMEWVDSNIWEFIRTKIG